ncbi:MAG: heparinase II/III-family protein [Paracoccaceae bacterium]
MLLSHDGYGATHGLTHMRHLQLARDGRTLLGEDTLAALEPADRKKFAQLLDAGRLRGVSFALRFHLHPDADASLDMGGTAISIALPSGELWVFRFDGPGKLSLEPSAYLERGRLAPRPCQQIVVRSIILDDHAQINWTLAKAQDTPLAIRDIGRDDDLAMPRDLFAQD